MNWNYFGLWGYVSLLLWAGVPLLWLAHVWKRPTRWLCHAALALALVAMVLAKINSQSHVNHIQAERLDEPAGLESLEEKKRKALEDSRGEEVAQVRFAEDGAGDFLDLAGMDEADRNYMEQVNESAAPDWKKNKGKRSRQGADDDSLEAAIGGGVTSKGLESDSLAAENPPEPILMSAGEMALAHRLDGLNLDITRFMVLGALLVLVSDYLKRANLYQKAGFPLPLPSAWINSLTPLPPVIIRPEAPRRNIAAELAWLARRGDSFVYLTDDPAAAAAIPESLPRLGKGLWPVEVLRVSEGDETIGDDFMFETLWYGRCSFVIDSSARAERIIGRFIKLLEERKMTRARVRQTAHIVWDLKQPMSEQAADDFARLARHTGFSLFLCQDPRRSS